MNAKSLYFIAVLPPEEIRDEIKSIKEEIKQKFDVKHALKLPAHITLQIPFRLVQEEEQNIISAIQNFIKTQAAFKTKLKNFNHFSNKVIFIPVSEPENFKLMHEKLQHSLLAVHEFKQNEIATKIHPHITLATRDLKRKKFPEIWKELEDRNFFAEFEVNSLVLFKHNGKVWQISKEFSFKI